MIDRSLSRETLSERLAPYRQISGLVDEFETPLGLNLQSAAPREIIARMLRNIKEIHKSQQDWRRLLAVQERLIVWLPQTWIEYRDRGLVHAELGHTEQALADLECYLVHAETSGWTWKPSQTRWHRYDGQSRVERLNGLPAAVPGATWPTCSRPVS